MKLEFLVEGEANVARPGGAGGLLQDPGRRRLVRRRPFAVAVAFVVTFDERNAIYLLKGATCQSLLIRLLVVDKNKRAMAL